MFHLVGTPTVKKRFCNHEYKIIFPHGTRKATKYCMKCKKSFQLKLSSQKITKYLPAFEQTENEGEDKYRFLTNYKNFEYYGFTIPGIKEAHDWCGLWQKIGCVHAEDHINSEHKGKIFLKQYKRGCFRPACETCYNRWQSRQANRSSRRILKYEKMHKKSPIHIILSIPHYNFDLSLKGMRKKARLVLQELGCIGGAIIFHPFRVKQLKLYWSPHFHVIGFGIVKAKIFQAYRKYGWVIIDKGYRKSVFGTFHYNLSHCGIKDRVKSMIWFGDLSYSNKELRETEPETGCPSCRRKLVPIYHDGVHSGIPPDEVFEGFVDSEDWYEVKTVPKSEWTKIERYEYALEKELYNANSGISLN